MSLPLPLSDEALDRLFRSARSFVAWKDIPVPLETLKALYDLVKMGPTSANGCPLRIVFLTTPTAKARLLPHLEAGNVHQTQAAPVVALLANDTQFPKELPTLFPMAQSWFEGKPALIQETAMRNASMQGGYFIMAARALGLDCGPISGFDNDGVNQDFFPDGRWQINFLCNIGYGDPAKLKPRLPRLPFEAACLVV
jgi:3-hydroxypropanoate dehydrogenase